MTINIRTWQDKGAWFASYCTGLESDLEQGNSRVDALENLLISIEVERPDGYQDIMSAINRELDSVYNVGARLCAHESVTTADGHGAYCKHCGETLA